MKPLLLLAVVLLCGDCSAQVRKCIAPDGKVTYSDAVCSAGVSTSSVRNLDVNSIDNSGFRRQAQAVLSQRDNDLLRQNSDLLRQNPPVECRFRFHSRDEKGKALAYAAQNECVDNIIAKRSGQPTSTSSYSMWKDHNGQTEGRRQAAVNRAVSSMNAQEIARSNAANTQRPPGIQENKKMTCRPNVMRDALICE